MHPEAEGVPDEGVPDVGGGGLTREVGNTPPPADVVVEVTCVVEVEVGTTVTVLPTVVVDVLVGLTVLVIRIVVVDVVLALLPGGGATGGGPPPGGCTAGGRPWAAINPAKAVRYTRRIFSIMRGGKI